MLSSEVPADDGTDSPGSSEISTGIGGRHSNANQAASITPRLDPVLSMGLADEDDDDSRDEQLFLQDELKDSMFDEF